MEASLQCKIIRDEPFPDQPDRCLQIGLQVSPFPIQPCADSKTYEDEDIKPL